MVGAACHRCGREWNYTGSSDRYGTCPNCKTSVKLNRGSEQAKPSETAERCPDPSDQHETVEVDAVEGEGVGVVEAVEALDEEVSQLYELGESRDGELAKLSDELDDQAAKLDDLREGLSEVAGFFAELVEEAGGEVEYENIDVEPAESPVPAVLENMDVEATEA